MIHLFSMYHEGLNFFYYIFIDSFCNEWICKHFLVKIYHLAIIYLFKFNNRNNKKSCKLCSKLTINIWEWRHWRPFGVFIGKFEGISLFSSVSINDCEQASASWAQISLKFRNYPFVPKYPLKLPIICHFLRATNRDSWTTHRIVHTLLKKFFY